MSELSDELKALLEMQHHRVLVQANLLRIADALRARAALHDISKYSLDEFQAVVQIKKVAREFPYGSAEYNQAISDNSVGLSKHFERNSHHPEFHSDGVQGMQLIDLIEMVCDWKAANTLRDDVQWSNVTAMHIERFKLSKDYVWLIDMIVDMLSNA